MTPFRPEASCPLDGITVLDLSRLVAGNMLSLQLADFGAEVIKIEDPGKGDPLRHWRVAGHSLFWKAYARNKKSLTLDLRKTRAKELLLGPIHSVIGADAAMYKAAGIIPRRQGSRSNITSPRNVYQTRDGRWISISASMQSMAERLYAAVGVPDMIKDPRFADNSARLA